MERGGLVLGFFAPPFPDVANRQAHDESNPQEQNEQCRAHMKP
jgi:hypothetical protein